MPEENFNTGRIDLHTEDEFRAHIQRAGRIITSSWFIGEIRHKSDGKWVPIVMFADDDNKEFAYAFEIRGGEPEVAAFNKRLRECQIFCTQRNG